jgi:hypothetical protein
MGAARPTYSGFNKLFVTAEGRLDVSALRKYVHEVSSVNPSNRALLNEITNLTADVLAKDSHVALLYNMIVGYLTEYYIEHRNKEAYRLHIPAADAPSLSDATRVHAYLEEFHFGVGPVSPLVRDVTYWANAVNTPSQGPSAPERVIRDFEADVDILTCPLYDDGHSVIDSPRFESAGFKHRRYAIHYKRHDMQKTKAKVVPQRPIDEPSVRYFHNFASAMDLTPFGETTRDVILWSLYYQRRRSPYLADNPVRIFSSSNEEWQGALIFCNQSGYDGARRGTFTSGEIAYAIRQLVQVYRLYDDYAEAMKYAVMVASQPEPNTVEAHAWFEDQLSMTLPAFSSYRTALPALVVGEPHLISMTGASAFFRDTSVAHTALMESLWLNTQWRFGLYLAAYNHDTERDIIRQESLGERIDMRPESFVGGMASLVTGREHWKFVHAGLGVTSSFTYDLFKQRSYSVKMSTMGDVLSLTGSVDGNTLRFDRLVPPGALAMIVGESGPLMCGTPMAAEFSTPALQDDLSLDKIIRSANILPLWAHAVVARWFGYDIPIEYLHAENRRAVVFAANEDQLIVPPTPPSRSRGSYSFIAHCPVERRKTWASMPNLGVTTDYRWTVDWTMVYERADHRSRAAAKVGNTFDFTRYLHEEMPAAVEKYTFYVKAEGSKAAGFTFAHNEMGRTRHPQVKTSPEEQVDIGDEVEQ